MDKNESISQIKFSGSQFFDSGLSESQASASDGQHLLVAHKDKLTILSAKDNFQSRKTFSVPEMYASEGR